MKTTMDIQNLIERKVEEFEGNFRLTVCSREDGLNDVLGMAEAQNRLNEHFESMKGFLCSSLHALLAEIESSVEQELRQKSFHGEPREVGGICIVCPEVKAIQEILDLLRPSEPKK